MSNTHSLLQNVYLFKELTARELDAVGAVAKLEPISAGDELFVQGDNATALYIIKLGTVKIQRSGKDDRVDVATIGSGAHFGEMAFLDNEKRSASAVAMEKGELIKIGFEDLKKVLGANPEIAIKVYRSLAHFLCGRLRVTTMDLTYAREKNLHHF